METKSISLDFWPQFAIIHTSQDLGTPCMSVCRKMKRLCSHTRAPAHTHVHTHASIIQPRERRKRVRQSARTTRGQGARREKPGGGKHRSISPPWGEERQTRTHRLEGGSPGLGEVGAVLRGPEPPVTRRLSSGLRGMAR